MFYKKDNIVYKAKATMKIQKQQNIPKTGGGYDAG